MSLFSRLENHETFTEGLSTHHSSLDTSWYDGETLEKFLDIVFSRIVSETFYSNKTCTASQELFHVFNHIIYAGGFHLVISVFRRYRIFGSKKFYFGCLINLDGSVEEFCEVEI